MSRIRINHRAAVLAAAVATAFASAAGVDAGIIRHDRSDNFHRGTGFAHDDTGWVLAGLSLGSGTLISPRWVLTAGHVVDGSQPSFNIGGATTSTTTSYAVSSFFPHPNWNANAILAGFDIGLMKLSGNGVTGITPASRFTAHDEVGRIGTSLGFGLFGEGDDPARTLDGRRRGGPNMIDAAGVAAYGAGTNPDILAADFDNPLNPAQSSFGSNVPLDFEYCVASGDSGGGMFVETTGGVTGVSGGRTYVAGIHSFVEAPDPPIGDNVDDSSYSDTYGSTRVSAFNAWVDDQITNKWTNASGGAFATAGNWSPGVVPDQYDIVCFNAAGTYTVTFAANRVSDRVIARGGNVTLNLAGNAYTLQSLTFEGSLIVGRYSGNVAGLTITNGVLTTREAVLAEQPGSTGTLTIGNAGTWNVVGDVYAGGNYLASGGTGTIALNTGSATSITGNLKLYSGGTLNLSGGGFTAAGIEQAGGTIAALVATTLATPINATSGGTLRADAAFHITGPLATATGTTLTKTGASTLTISGPQAHGANTTLTVSAGTLNLDSNAGANLAVNANATTNLGSSQNLRGLTVANNITATVTPGGNKTVKTDALTVTGNGKLDLKSNALVVNYTGVTVEPQIAQRLTDGFHGGDWLGPGIMSSSAGSSGLFALGYGEAGDIFNLLTPGATATFRGQTVDDTSILVRYTYGGDANLDGLISGDDYTAIDFNISVPGARGYWRGDFNYDGIISGDDYSTIDFNIVAQGPPLGMGSIAEGITAVPEPSMSACLFASALASSVMRRRRSGRRA